MKRLGGLLFIVFLALLILNWPVVPSGQRGQPHRSLLQSIKSKIQKPEQISAETQMLESASPPENSVSAEFRKWFESETRNLEQEHKDSIAVESVLKTRAQNLKPLEITFLKNKVLQSQVANEKIISVYMLSLTSQEAALQALAEISNQEAQYPSPQPVHSPEETLSMQEKTLKRMALEALFEKAQTNAEARQLFHQNIDRIADPELRAYAQRKDRELP